MWRKNYDTSVVIYDSIIVYNTGHWSFLDLEERPARSEKSEIRQRSVSRDFIDIYLEKMEETKDERSSFYGPQGLANLQRSLTDLFGAGSETSSSVLLFAFLYMIKYPDVQVGCRMWIWFCKDALIMRLNLSIELDLDLDLDLDL